MFSQPNLLISWSSQPSPKLLKRAFPVSFISFDFHRVMLREGTVWSLFGYSLLDGGFPKCLEIWLILQYTSVISWRILKKCTCIVHPLRVFPYLLHVYNSYCFHVVACWPTHWSGVGDVSANSWTNVWVGKLIGSDSLQLPILRPDFNNLHPKDYIILYSLSVFS